MTERDSQISSLLEKLHQFNLQYDDLQKFVREGNDLLAQEKPVGADAARVQEQMDTCQVQQASGWPCGTPASFPSAPSSPLRVPSPLPSLPSPAFSPSLPSLLPLSFPSPPSPRFFPSLLFSPLPFLLSPLLFFLPSLSPSPPCHFSPSFPLPPLSLGLG